MYKGYSKNKVKITQFVIKFILVLIVSILSNSKSYSYKVLAFDINENHNVEVKDLKLEHFIEDFNSLEYFVTNYGTDILTNEAAIKREFNYLKPNKESVGDDLNKFYIILSSLFNKTSIHTYLESPKQVIELSKNSNFKYSYNYKVFNDPIVVNKNKDLSTKIIDNSKVLGINMDANVKENINIKNNPISTKILEKDKIAYVRISSFKVWNMDYEKELSKFFESIENYPNLIIDIRGNTGGVPNSWVFIMSALTPKELISERYYGLRDNEISKAVVDSPTLNFYLKDEKKEILKENPQAFTKVDENLFKNFKYLVKCTGIIEAKSKHPFKGKIFILVDDSNASSADLFAQTAKNTGFATLVGNNTKGDGSARGEGSYYYALPNSGFVFRIQCAHSLNIDGSSNVLYGTEPNYKTQKGKELEFVQNFLIK